MLIVTTEEISGKNLEMLGFGERFDSSDRERIQGHRSKLQECRAQPRSWYTERRLSSHSST